MWITDRLASFVSGLGTSKDKTTSLRYHFSCLSDEQLNAMHRTDWLARKIVDIIPNDMTREWRDWQADGDVIGDIEALEKAPTINLQVKVNQALQKARLFGGSAIYMGMRDGTPDLPLDPETVNKGDLLYLNVLTRREITAGEINYDVASEYYGQPAWYEITGINQSVVRVHPSRIVRFIGAEILDNRFQNAYGWGDSVLQIVYDAVLNAGSVQQHVAALIPESKVDVIYIPKLSDYLKNEATTKLLTERFAYANTIKSQFNMTLLEGNGGSGDQAAGEKWEQKQISFAQMSEIMAQYLQIASGAADIPVTRLIGTSPKGLNATGDSDIRNYYDNIAARQRVDLQPALHRLDEVLIRSATGARDPSITFEWAPLWGLSEVEKATVFKTKADAVRTLAGGSPGQAPIFPIEAISDAAVNMFVEDGIMPGLEAAIEEYGSLSEQNPGEDETAAALTPATAAGNGQQSPIRVAANDATPKTLYVRRDVVNAAEIKAWAEGQGIKDIVPDLHVTIVYSRTPVDWIKAGNAGEWDESKNGQMTIPPGGPRVVEPLGDMTAVLMFASSRLSWRHEDIVRAGASHDFEDYQPHISLTKVPIDVTAIEPYRGAIVLGPEVFEPLNED